MDYGSNKRGELPLEDTFKLKEGDRKKQIQGLKEQIRSQEERISRCDNMLLNREIDKETHQRMIPKLKEEITILKEKIKLRETSETGFMKYCRFGIPLLSNLHGFYLNASVEIKQKLLGSIFPAKLHFREESYRTTPLNPALALILQKNKVLENEKTGQDLFCETLSGELPFTDLTSNQFIDGMRKIYELEPFIKTYSTNTNREGEKYIQEVAVASL
jgi:hypothetical protein